MRGILPIEAAACAALILVSCGSSADRTAKCEIQTGGVISDQLASLACGGDEFAQYEIGPRTEEIGG